MNIDVRTILGAVFIAGGFWVFIRLTFKQVSKEIHDVKASTSKDINGLGIAVRADRTAEEFRALTEMFTALVHTDSEERRRWLADKFLNGWRRP